MAENNKDSQDKDKTPEKTSVFKKSLKDLAMKKNPEKTMVKPKAMDPPTEVEEQPQKTAVAPRKADVAPEKTAVAPSRNTAGNGVEKTAVAQKGNKSQRGISSSDNDRQVGDVINVGGHTCTIVRCIGSGTEGDLYVVKEGSKTYALKKCHDGFTTNTKVMPALQQLKGKGYVVDIEAYGDDFELMEYVQGDSAAHVRFDRKDKESLAKTILAIATGVAMTLDAMHKQNVLHKDVKPANILIKDTTSWACVLCDFGIADVLKEQTYGGIIRKYCVTRRSRTPIYAAPEIYKTDNAILNDDGSISSEMTPKADFYSLGMTILSLWLGEDAMNKLEVENALTKMRGNISVPDDMPDPLNRITRGLLIKDPTKRWDLNSIINFLNGEDVPVEEEEILADLNIVYNQSKHQIAHNLDDLAAFMADDVTLAARYLYKGQLNKWLRDYPELLAKLDDIVENRYPKDTASGVTAALYAICPDQPYTLYGIDRKTHEPKQYDAYSLKEVGDFFNTAYYDSNSALNSVAFKEWVRLFDAKIADTLPHDAYLRLQTICPLTDINLCNNPNDPDYAMTTEGIAQLMNRVYNIFWNRFEGDDYCLYENDGSVKESERLKDNIDMDVYYEIVTTFVNHTSSYIIDFMKTKPRVFTEKHINWFEYGIDLAKSDSEENDDRVGPNDEIYLQQMAWMKTIKGCGINPIYHLEDEDADVTTVDELLRFSKKTLRKEFRERGLRGWLAVQFQEDPYADLSKEYNYENLLLQYLETIRKIDSEDIAVERFDEAVKEVKQVVKEGRSRVAKPSRRNAIQRIVTLLFGILPSLALVALIVSSIIAHPTLEVGSSKWPNNFIWIVGLVVGAIYFFVSDSDGCVIPIILGVVGATVLFIIFKFVSALILYIYLIIVLASLITFSIKTLFSSSEWADEAKKLENPDFEESTVEPLIYAFNDDITFESSLDNIVDESSIELWEEDINERSKRILIFIGVTLLLWLFSLLLPRAGDDVQNPFVRKVEQLLGRDKANNEETLEILAMPVIEDKLQIGSKGEAVTIMQKRLSQLGYYEGEITDTFDKTTAKAVKAFQKAHKLKVDGVVGEKTLEKMFSDNAVKINNEQPTESEPVKTL